MRVASIAALILLALPTGGRSEEGRAALGDTLKAEGVDLVFLESTFRFAADFNARDLERRRGARIVGVSPTFVRAVAPRIYPVLGPVDRGAATTYLKTRLTKFLEGYVGFLIDQKVEQIELRESESIAEYLHRSAGANRCNQIPCARPPCCKDCSAPSSGGCKE